MNPRAAITAVFFVNGALFASWASRIPALSDRVGARTGGLGLALLAPAVGAVVAMPLVGRLLPGRSSRTFCRIALAALMAAILLPAAARSLPALAGALFVVGMTNSTLDLVMNAQGVSIERGIGRSILSSLHAAFSFGGFAGAGLGALAAALHVAPPPHLAAAALLFGIPGLIATRSLLASDEDADARAPTLNWRRMPSRLALLGAVCFFCLMAEGGASDWSAKLVRDDLAGSAALGAIAYAGFSIAMGAGRLITDRLWARWGSVALLRRSGALAGLGFAAGLLPGTAPAAIAGFAALGLGLAGVVPTLFRAGADEPGVSTGPALAVVSSLGYLGFLAGPPLIGGVAQ
ncbi:MAG: MFS transporter, partial [Actinomycetota bacterium]|nr:MFS transporter [Actinomycetota bacterium]